MCNLFCIIGIKSIVLKKSNNILPYDGEVYYFADFFNASESDLLFNNLQKNISWSHDEVIMFGKKIIMDRMVAWYAHNNLAYSYSKTKKNGLPLTQELTQINKKIEDKYQLNFNSCLLNFYQNGLQSMGWHSDNEKELGINPIIASISFGAPRRFVLKHKTTQAKVELLLENGSLLIMQGAIQHHWLHALPKTTKINDARINLTFRQIK